MIARIYALDTYRPVFTPTERLLRIVVSTPAIQNHQSSPPIWTVTHLAIRTLLCWVYIISELQKTVPKLLAVNSKTQSWYQQ